MAQRLVEGLWDCPYCQEKGIGGLSKHCPNCGHPQDKGIRFYLGERKKYLTNAEAEQVGTGPDWVCGYCDSYNSEQAKFCTNCGAPKDSKGDDYFTNKARQEEKQRLKEADRQENIAKMNGTYREPKKRSVLPLILIMAALVAGIAFFLMPRSGSGEISSKEWQRSVDIQEYRTLQEDGWSLPSDGRLIRTAREIQSYKDVLDHYETRTRQVPESVFDGYETRTSYSDNGNGTYTETTTQVPVYRTEYRTESYEEPIYRKEPVYGTRYYYEVDRWVFDRTETSSGGDDEPYWPDPALDSNERESSTYEDYILNVTIPKNEKTYPYSTTLEEWKQYSAGDKVKYVLQTGQIKSIEK